MRRAQISIHAAREGGDTTVGHERLAAFLFQSTPPVKAATTEALSENYKNSISIHAAREGGDPGAFLIGRMMPNFNPRRP